MVRSTISPQRPPVIASEAKQSRKKHIIYNQATFWIATLATRARDDGLRIDGILSDNPPAQRPPVIASEAKQSSWIATRARDDGLCKGSPHE